MDAAYRTLEAKHVSTPAGEGVGVALLVLSLGVLSGWLTGAMRLASWGRASPPRPARGRLLPDNRVCFLHTATGFRLPYGRAWRPRGSGRRHLWLAFVAGSNGSDAMMVPLGRAQGQPLYRLGMWPSAAVGFTFAGLGLALRARKGAATFAVALAGLVGVVGIIALLEQTFGYDDFDAVPGFGPFQCRPGSASCWYPPGCYCGKFAGGPRCL